MTSKEVASLYFRAGFAPPQEIGVPAPEHIRNTRRKTVDGIDFRSTLEADVCQLLKLWQTADRISDLECQPIYILQEGKKSPRAVYRAIYYRADFRFQRDGRTVVIEAKGFRTQVYMIKRKLFLARYPDIQFEEWTKETLRANL